MARYAVRAAKPMFVETPLWDDQRESFRPCLDVDGAKDVDTGLVTENGDPIYRLGPPIGFGRTGEW